MAVFRIERTKDYTVMSNHHLRNHELSLKAKGLLCYENLPPEGRNNPARPDGRLIDCISCWIRRSRAGHQVPSPMLSGVSGNYVFFYPD